MANNESLDEQQNYEATAKKDGKRCVVTFSNKTNADGVIEPRGGGGYSIYPWVGRSGAAPHTLTLFKTNIADFPTLFKTFNLNIN